MPNSKRRVTYDVIVNTSGSVRSSSISRRLTPGVLAIAFLYYEASDNITGEIIKRLDDLYKLIEGRPALSEPDNPLRPGRGQLLMRLSWAPASAIKIPGTGYRGTTEYRAVKNPCYHRGFLGFLGLPQDISSVLRLAQYIGEY